MESTMQRTSDIFPELDLNAEGYALCPKCFGVLCPMGYNDPIKWMLCRKCGFETDKRRNPQPCPVCRDHGFRDMACPGCG